MKKRINLLLPYFVISIYVIIAYGSATQQQTAQRQAQAAALQQQAATQQGALDYEQKILNNNISLASEVNMFDVSKLNFYKYIYFPKVPSSIQENSSELWNQINDTLQKCGLNIKTSKTDIFNRIGISEKDFVTCTYSQKYYRTPYPNLVGIWTKLVFTNYEKDTILFFFDRFKHNDSAKHLAKSMENILQAFSNYHYTYSNWLATKNNQSSNNENNSPKVVTSANNNKSKNSNSFKNNTPQKQSRFFSDVDKNIPDIHKRYSNRFALIIGNEDYSSYQKSLHTEANVNYAKRDAEVFKKYAIKTMGIPESNIIFKINATSIEMHRAINQISLISKALNGSADIIFYYAGHGFPSPVTKEPYLIPVDVNSTDLQYAIELKSIYEQLTKYPTKRVTVFLDACFSGGGREQGLIASRGIKIEANSDLLMGNIAVFSASKGTETALPYDKEKHGMFTYFLLKKLQETSGNVTYSDIENYLQQKVNIKSVIDYSQEQNPTINVGVNVKNSWRNWKIDDN